MSSAPPYNPQPLMGFSVYQPVVGAALQFFPAMGTKQLDDLIDAYVPGDALMSEKRAAVSMEFCQYALVTRNQYKFFMVYPSIESAGTSPAMQSDIQSGFTTSPTPSGSQWIDPSPRIPSRSPPTRPTDISQLPGMKILTKDGRDVTNSASRGCKTKEQRDHAHLMRKIKACDSCRRKKTKCDPSHKRPSAVLSSGVTKKSAKASRPAAPPPPEPSKASPADSLFAELDRLLAEEAASKVAAPSADDQFLSWWDEYIRYDEEPVDFAFEDIWSPPIAIESLSTSSISPQYVPATPVDLNLHMPDNRAEGHNHAPILPYLDARPFEAGSNYVDFNLYSPQSSFLDDVIDPVKEVAASPVREQPNDAQSWFSRDVVDAVKVGSTSPVQSQRCHRPSDVSREPAMNAAAFQSSHNAVETDHAVIAGASTDVFGGSISNISNTIQQPSASAVAFQQPNEGDTFDHNHARSSSPILHVAPGRLAQFARAPSTGTHAALGYPSIQEAGAMTDSFASNGISALDPVYAPQRARACRSTRSSSISSPSITPRSSSSLASLSEDAIPSNVHRTTPMPTTTGLPQTSAHRVPSAAPAVLMSAETQTDSSSAMPIQQSPVMETHQAPVSAQAPTTQQYSRTFTWRKLKSRAVLPAVSQNAARTTANVQPAVSPTAGSIASQPNHSSSDPSSKRVALARQTPGSAVLCGMDRSLAASTTTSTTTTTPTTAPTTTAPTQKCSPSSGMLPTLCATALVLASVLQVKDAQVPVIGAGYTVAFLILSFVSRIFSSGGMFACLEPASSNQGHEEKKSGTPGLCLALQSSSAPTPLRKLKTETRCRVQSSLMKNLISTSRISVLV